MILYNRFLIKREVKIMKDEQFETLVNMQQQHFNSLVNMINNTKDELIVLNQQTKAELTALNQQTKNELTALIQQNKDEFTALNQQTKDELAALIQQNKKELIALNKQTKDELIDINKDTRKELDQKTDILLKFITKSATGLRNEFKNAIRESESRLYQSISDLREEFRTYKQINGREHQTIINTIEERYSSHEKEIISLNQGLSTLYALSKLNDVKHKEYDNILARNNLQ